MDFGSWVQDVWVWTLRWRRRLYDCEKRDLSDLHVYIYSHKPSRSHNDGVRWNGSNDDKYSKKIMLDILVVGPSPLLSRFVTNFIW